MKRIAIGIGALCLPFIPAQKEATAINERRAALLRGRAVSGVELQEQNSEGGWNTIAVGDKEGVVAIPPSKAPLRLQYRRGQTRYTAAV